MRPITQQEIVDYVEANIQTFHRRRLDKLQELKLMNVVKRKNPYLFKAKNIRHLSKITPVVLRLPLHWHVERIAMGKYGVMEYQGICCYSNTPNSQYPIACLLRTLCVSASW